MCTVKDLIDKLQSLDPDTVVQVISVYGNGFGGSDNEWVDLDITNYWGENKSETFDYINLRDNPFATKEEQLEKPILLLGEC